MTYKAFLSYSHAADGRLAPRLQIALHRFAKPWYMIRAIRLFRDKTGLSVKPGLWSSIEQALRESEYFILLASPESAKSEWVQREIDYWIKDRSPEKLLIVLTDGELVWDSTTVDFNWNRTNAVPTILKKVFSEEPLFLDLRWAKNEEQLSLNHLRFREAVAQLGATLRGQSLDELYGEEVRQHRSAKRLILSAISALVILTLASIISAYLAIKQRDIALSRELAASARSQLKVKPELALLLAIEAVTLEITPQSEDVLRESLLALRLRSVFIGHTKPVREVTFSPDGKWLITIHSDGKMGVWNVLTGKAKAMINSTQYDKSMQSAVISPDSKLLAVATDNNTLRIWEIETGLDKINLKGSEARIITAAFSPDGKLVATGSQDRTARIWEVSSGRVITTLKGHNSDVTSILFSFDSKFIVTDSDDRTARIWEVTTGKSLIELGALRPLLGKPRIALSHDSKKVAITHDQGIVSVRDVSTGNIQITFRGHKAQVTSLAFSPNDQYVLTASWDGTARVWDANTGEEKSLLHKHGAWVQNAVFSPNGKLVATASDDHTARLWETINGREVAILRGHTSRVWSAKFSPNGQMLATVSSDATTQLWDASPTKGVIELRGHPSPVTDISISSEGKFVTTSSYDMRVRVWNADTGKKIREIEVPSSRFGLFTAAFSPTDKYVVTGDSGGIWQIQEVETGKILCSVKVQGGILSAKFSPDGEFVVTTSGMDGARVWKVSTCQQATHLLAQSAEPLDSVLSSAFDTQGQWVVTTSTDGTARVWEALTGRQLVVLRGHSDRVWSAAFSPDSDLVVTSGEDETLRVWNVRSGEQLMLLRGHEGSVRSVEFSPDGKFLVSVGADKTARVWEVASGETVAILRGHTREVTNVRFSPDGKFVLTASADGTARIYPQETFITLEKLLALARKRVTRELTSKELKEYLHITSRK